MLQARDNHITQRQIMRNVRRVSFILNYTLFSRLNFEPMPLLIDIRMKEQRRVKTILSKHECECRTYFTFVCKKCGIT